MGKISVFMMVSIDGYFEGPNHDISWHNIDSEFNKFATEQLDEFDGLIFGKRTYEMMVDFWPTAKAKKDDPLVAGRMNSMPKLVASTSLEEAIWYNTQLVNTEKLLEEKKSNKSWLVLGSSNLCVSLIKYNLLDEVRLIINPVAIGKGTSLFEGLETNLKLKLTESRNFKSGNVLNIYKII